MLYNGNEYPERLMVIGPSTFYGNRDSVYLFGVEFFGVIDPDKCSGGIPEETVCEFSSSHYSLLESDAAEKRCGKDNIHGGFALYITNIANGNVFEEKYCGVLYSEEGFVDSVVGDSPTNVIEQIFMFNMSGVSKFSDVVRVSIMEKLLSAFEDKVVVFIDDASTWAKVDAIYQKNAEYDDVREKICFIYTDSLWGKIVRPMYDDDGMRKICIKYRKDSGWNRDEYVLSFPKYNRQGYVEREETFYYDRSVCNKIAYLARKVWK